MMEKENCDSTSIHQETEAEDEQEKKKTKKQTNKQTHKVSLSS